jgi:hypothetical protein
MCVKSGNSACKVSRSHAGRTVIAQDLKAEFEALVDALAAAGIDFAVCGAFAVAIHGAPRFTKDIDLLVMPDDLGRLLEVARSLGFDLPAAPMTFDAGKPAQRTVHRVSKAKEGHLLSLDVILMPPIFQDVWANRILVEWERRRVPVVSLEGLIKMKEVAGRDQDRLDIRKLTQGDFGDEEH